MITLFSFTKNNCILQVECFYTTIKEKHTQAIITLQYLLKIKECILINKASLKAIEINAFLDNCFLHESLKNIISLSDLRTESFTTFRHNEDFNFFIINLINNIICSCTTNLIIICIISFIFFSRRFN